MTTFEEVRARASRPEDVVRLVLDGAVVAELRELERLLGDAPLPTNLGEPSPAAKYAEQIEAARERMRASEVPFRIRAMPGREWTPFYDSRPTKGDNETDEAWGGRWFTWLCELVARTVFDPVMTAEQVAELSDELPASSWADLYDACWLINTGKVSVPFSAAASVLTRLSELTSKPPSGSGSRSAGSGAASQRKSRRTSTTTKGA